MKKVVDIIVVGFAIFSMFFGAGNLIFPPYIGMASGSGWLISYLGFIISDVGMILLSIIAIAKAGSYQFKKNMGKNQLQVLVQGN